MSEAVNTGNLNLNSIEAGWIKNDEARVRAKIESNGANLKIDIFLTQEGDNWKIFKIQQPEVVENFAPTAKENLINDN